jgi:hypothetical protein
MMSSDWQVEQTGVDRAARIARAVRRPTIWAVSWFELNGLRSEACVMSPIYSPLKVYEIQELMRSMISRVSRPILWSWITLLP